MAERSGARWLLLALVAVFMLAAVMRLYPLVQFSVWGSDWGEYYHLTERLHSEGVHPSENLGWGQAYVDFPGMFDLAAAGALLTGVPTDVAMSFIVPAMTALSCLLVACIVLRLGAGPWAALLAALFLAVAFPEPFQNSHAIPGALGSVLTISAVLALLMGDTWARDPEADEGRPRSLYALYLLAVMALTVTHHMSLYFLIIAAALAHLLRGLMVTGREGRRELWGAWCVVVPMASATAYWMFMAPNFREEVMVDLLGLPGWSMLMGAWAGVLVMLTALHLRDPDRARIPRLMFTGPRQLRMILAAFIGGGLLVMAMVAAWGMPGTKIEPGWDILVYLAPLLVAFSLAVGSTDELLLRRGGHAALAWLVAIVASFLVASAVGTRVLLSYRHLPYATEAAAVFVGVGALHLARMTLPDRRSARATAGSLVAVLMALLVVTSYPPKEIMGGFQEGTEEREVSAALWLRGGLPAPGASPADEGSGAVASDHRLSSLAFGLGGAMATWDYADATLHSPMGEGVMEELSSVDTPGERRPVTAVLLSEDLRSGAAMLQWEPAEPVEGEAWEKFFEPPFVRLYDGGSVWVVGVSPGS